MGVTFQNIFINIFYLPICQVSLATGHAKAIWFLSRKKFIYYSKWPSLAWKSAERIVKLLRIFYNI
jgi:hypothetical protein